MSLKNVFAVVKRRTHVSTYGFLTNVQPRTSHITRTQPSLFTYRPYSDSSRVSVSELCVSAQPPSARNTSRARSSPDPMREFLRLGTKTQIEGELWSACKAFTKGTHHGQPPRCAATKAEKDALLQLVFRLVDSIELGYIDAVIRLLSSIRIHWGIEYDLDVYTRILETLHGRGMKWSPTRNLATRRLLWQMKLAIGITPTVDQWNTFLRISSLRRRVSMVRASLPFMRESGCTPDEETYHIFFSALFSDAEQIPHKQKMIKLLHEMKNDGATFTPSLLDVIVKGYASVDGWAQIAAVKRIYGETSIPSGGLPEGYSAQRVEEQLIDALQKNRASSAEHLFYSFVRKGYKPSPATLDSLSQHLPSIAALRRWQQLLGTEPSAFAWTNVIKNTLSAGRVRAALVAYQQLISDGSVPTLGLLHSLLRALCSNKLAPPSDNAIDKALELFRQYRDRVQAHPKVTIPPQQDLPLYNTLLRALTSSANAGKYFPFAVSLLEEMRARGIAMDPMTSTSFIVLLIRSSPSPTEALNAYKKARFDKDGQPVLDKKGYTAVLNAFCEECVSAPSEAAPYMEIVKDMRLSGHQIPVEVYTILIRQLATIAARIPSDDHDQRATLIATLRRIQSYITVEASLTPDVYLWNQLMDAYQHVGCYGDAYKLWESMRVSGEFDNASVSIILDACAFAGAYQEAVDIFARLRKDGFALNKKNWDTFVETLCYLGRVEEALKVVCLEMAKDKLVYPDRQTVGLLLRFLAGTVGEEDARARIMRYLPEISIPPEH